MKQTVLDTQVAIIGAGPTGLMLANQLKRYGIEFLLVDVKSGPTPESRALGVSARSMELYQQLGLAESVLARSKPISGFIFLQNGSVIEDINLADLGVGHSDFTDMMITFEQSANEETLFENLDNLKDHVLWRHRYIGHSESAGGVSITVSNEEQNENLTLIARYLVGCDGASSTVRHQLDLSFGGGTYKNLYYVVDCSVTWPYDDQKVILSPARHHFLAFFPRNGHEKMRIIGNMEGAVDKKQVMNLRMLKRMIRSTAGITADIYDLTWHSEYRLHHRCVNSFKSGRVFLAGDSAHIHSPAGGQGMNTGLQDAHNLGWKLAMVVNGFGRSALLETYHNERWPVAKRLLQFTDRAFRYMAATGWWAAVRRRLILLPLIKLFIKLPSFRKRAFYLVSQLDIHYRKSDLSMQLSRQQLSFNAGDRLPYYRPEALRIIRKPGFHLLRIAAREWSAEELTAIHRRLPFTVHCHAVERDEFWRSKGVSDPLYLLVRPDHYISVIADTAEDLLNAECLGRYFKAGL